MGIDPEIIPSSSREGNKSSLLIPRWIVYTGAILLFFIALGILRALFPLIVIFFIVYFLFIRSKKS